MASVGFANMFFLVILSGTVICLVLAVCLFAGAICWRLRLVARQRRLGPVIEEWRRHFAVGVGEETPVSQIRYRDAFTILNLWNKLHQGDSQSASAQESARLAAIGRHQGFARIASRVLERGDDNDRIVALTTLGYLGERGAVEAAQVLTRHRNGDLSFAAYRALVLIKPDELTNFLEAVPARSNWSITDVERFLQELPPEQSAAAFRHALEGASKKEAIQLLRYLPSCELQAARTAVMAILEATSDPDVATAALRALGHRGHHEDRAVIRRFIDHGQPVHLRLSALNALLPLSKADDHDLLVSLLGDTSYWIRYRAAQALVRMPHGDAEASRLVELLQDPYSRDILKQALAEGAWDSSRAIFSQHAHRNERSAVRPRRHRADAMRTEI